MGAPPVASYGPPRPIPAQPYPPRTPGLPWLAWLPRAGLRRLLAAAPVVAGVVGGDGVRDGHQHAAYLYRNRMVTGCAHALTLPSVKLLDEI